MPKLLNEDAITQLNRDGYYFPVKILDEEQAEACRARLEKSRLHDSWWRHSLMCGLLDLLARSTIQTDHGASYTLEFICLGHVILSLPGPRQWDIR